MAVGLSLAFIAAASSPALADHVRRNEWWLRTLHVTNAWETTRGSGVTIAVLDTGVDRTQADLTGSVTRGPDYTNSGETPGSPYWEIHGTEVASLIAGHGHGPGQASGIIGIAPAAKIISARVTLESNDPSLSEPTIAAGLPNAIARGINWAVRNHASVIDLPLDPVTTAGAPGSGGSPAEKAAVRYAIAKHVVLVAPAGDGGAGTDPVNYPAAYHGVIVVGAFGRHFVKAPFSSHRAYVMVTAAGAGVTAAGPSGSYPKLNSTSAASAMVAGIVALIRAQFPKLSPAQITRAITSGTVHRRPGGRADGSGYGAVDAAKALTAAAAIDESVSKSPASGPASQAAPTPPAGHSSPIHRNIRTTLIKDAVIAGVVFLLLLGLIFGIKAWRRRNARSARLAEVRAAVQPPIRKPAVAKSAAPGKAKTPGKAKKGATAGVPGEAHPEVSGPDAGAAEPQLEPAGFIAAPLGATFGAPGASGFTGSASSGFTGSSFTGSSFTGSGFTGSGFTGSASSGFAAGSPTPPSPGGLAAFIAAGINPPGGGPSAGSGPGAGSGSSAGLGAAGISPPTGISPPADVSPPADPSPPADVSPPGGFGPTARLGPAAASDASGRPGPSAGFGSPAGPGSPGGSGSSDGPVAQDASPGGEATPGLTQSAGVGTGMPPWGLISQDPAVRAAASAAIPGRAFPGAPAASPTDEAASGMEPAPGSGPGGAGVTRMSSRLTQTPRQSRMPQVSGRPPWEAAPEPNSELPWAQAPAPSRGAGSLPMPEQVPPQLPSWEEMAQDAWPGGPKLAGPHPSTPSHTVPNGLADREGGRPAGPRVIPAAGLVPPQPDSPEQPSRTENRPVYGWNAGAGVEPFPAAQAERGPAPGGTDAALAGSGPPTGGASSDMSPSAVSQPGVSPARRPSLALPRRLGSSLAGQIGSAAEVGSDESQADASPAGGGLAAQAPAGGGLAVPGTGDSGLADTTSASPNWPGGGAGQAPFPPAPRPAGEPSLPSASASASQAPFPPAPKPATETSPPDAGLPPFPSAPKPATEPSLPSASTGANQPPFPPAPKPATEPSLASAAPPERGPFPRAIKPPTDPGTAGTAAWGAGAIGARLARSSAATPAFPQEDKPANGAGAMKDGQPGAGAALPLTDRPDAVKPDVAKPEEGSARPKTGVPPWEITDSFLAVPPAEATAAPTTSGPTAAGQPSNPPGGSSWAGEPTAASQPSNPRGTGTGGGGPTDSTVSFPAVGYGTDQRSFPGSNPGDSTESFPATRPRAKLEDAFRLFPPVRGTDNQPPADSQD